MPVMRLLLDSKADVTIVNADGMTALHLACWKGQLEPAKLLLAKGADPNARDHDRSCPLHEAVRSGSAPVVQLLLSSGSNPAMFDKVCSRSCDCFYSQLYSTFQAGSRNIG